MALIDAPRADFGELEDPLNNLSFRQEAIMALASDRLSKLGGVTFTERECGALLFLLGEQSAALKDVVKRYEALTYGGSNG